MQILNHPLSPRQQVSELPLKIDRPEMMLYKSSENIKEAIQNAKVL